MPSMSLLEELFENLLILKEKEIKVLDNTQIQFMCTVSNDVCFVWYL